MKKTITFNIPGERDSFADIWKETDGMYYYCLYGHTANNLSYESDDIGPFTSAEQAEVDARKRITERGCF